MLFDAGNLISNHPDNKGLRAAWIDLPGSSGVRMTNRLNGQFHLLPTNSPSKSATPFGKGAFRLASASSQFMRSTSPVVTQLPVAVCAWVYTFSNHNGTIWDCRRSSGGFTGFSISPRSNGAVRWYQNGGTQRFVSTSAGVLPIATWTRVSGFAVSATDYRVYINGVKVLTGTSNTGTTFSSVTVTNIGRYEAGGGSGEYFNGLIGDVWVWGGSDFFQNDPDAFMARDYQYSQRLETDPRIRSSTKRYYTASGGGGGGTANNLLLLGVG